jgi:heavy metal sensor kinase
MKSARARLLATLAGGLAIGLALTVAWAGLATSNALRQDIDRLVQDRAYSLAKSVSPEFPMLQPWMETFLQTERDRIFAQLFDREGRLLAKSLNLSEAVPISDEARRAPVMGVSPFTETVKRGDGAAARVATIPFTFFRAGANQVQGFVQIGILLRESEARWWKLMASLAGVALLLLAGVLFLARLVIDQWLHSVTAAAESARRFSTQTLTHERLYVPPNDDELARLARAFNELLDRLEHAHSTLQHFVADASHELRTPLTVLRGEIDVALRRPRSADEYREVLQSNKEEIDRLSRLAENLLTLAHADAGEVLARREPVDLNIVCAEVGRKLSPMADEFGVNLAWEVSAPAVVSGDAVALERVVANLVENGLRYTPRGENVTVRTAVENDWTCICVSDTGVGIAPEHLPRIFERFYRVDKSRSRAFGGAGLGLSIVETFVKAHGGTVEARSEVGQGSVFTVRLPRSAEPENQ